MAEHGVAQPLDVAFGAATEEDCAREQIQIPGSVQPHAALLVLDGDRVVQSTRNAAELLNCGPVNGAALSDVLGGEAARAVTALAPAAGPGRLSTRITVRGIEVDATRSLTPQGCEVLQLEPVAGSEDSATSFAEIVTTAVGRLHGATTVVDVADTLCELVREVTGFDRVMAYAFQPDQHGVVVAERRAPELEPFLGLHYPASDIPAQARALYLRSWLRLIPDARYTPVPLEPAVNPTTQEPLDLSDVTCRSVSPIHCEYLANMGVRASMSLSLVVNGALWGLIACHHYSGPRRPSEPTRQVCEFLALAASGMLASRLAERRATEALRVEEILNQLAAHLLADDDLVQGLLSDPRLLPELLDADGAVVLLGGRYAGVGRVPPHEVVHDLIQQLAQRYPGQVVQTDRLAVDFAVPEGLTKVAAGLVALPLSSQQRNYLVWFRQPWPREVTWGGEPSKAVSRHGDGSQRLRPRRSFAVWVESVDDRSRPWHPDRLVAVGELRGLLARHITRTAEQLSRLNADLVRSNAELDAFAYVAAHDLKEPLRGMANYAAFLAEDYGDLLDEEGRQQLELMTHLATRMNGLLASLLRYARVGRTELRREQLRLSAVVAEVQELVGRRLADRGGTLEVRQDTVISADPDLVGQLLMNLITNALKYNVSDRPMVEVGVTTPSSTRRGSHAVNRSVLAEVEPQVLYVRDNGIGIPEDRMDDVFRVFRRLHAPDEFGGGEGAGLTIARRIVQRHGGVMWVESVVDQGSTFYFTLGSDE